MAFSPVDRRMAEKRLAEWIRAYTEAVQRHAEDMRVLQTMIDYWQRQLEATANK